MIIAEIFIIFGAITLNEKFYLMGSVDSINVMISMVICAGAVAIIVLVMSCGINVIKKALCNVKLCDDPVFDTLDCFRKHWGKGDNLYIRRIKMIDLYYKEGGEVDRLVKNNEIERLYKRADFLQTQSSLFDNLMICFNSLFISVIASFAYEIMGSKNTRANPMGMVIIVIFFFCVALARYVERGHAGSYGHYIDEYERKLLMEKIESVEKGLIITDDDERILKTQQIVINELIDIIKKKRMKKQKRKLENDIKCVEQLDLCLGDYSDYCVKRICINGREGYLVYDKKKGKENNYIGESNLANEEYAKLYQILRKYDLV